MSDLLFTQVSIDTETIFALSTGIGKSAVAIIRVSGSKCKIILESLCGRTVWPERRAIYASICDRTGQLLDKGIVIFFKSPRSFTGEDMVEFQITGGRATSTGLLQALSQFPQCRPAEAGEYARRAFENGKIDLVEVEGLAAIIDADSAAEARQSALMAFGKVSQQCERARDELLEAAALMEGMLDFSDIEDPDGTTIDVVVHSLMRARTTLQSLLHNGRVTERLREGFAVAIVGAPNVGKSTLINKILERDAVIVSDIPGTTRDYLEFFVELGGFPVVFVDTAGFRMAVDPIERLGIQRSQERIRAVDLIVWLSPHEHISTEFIPVETPMVKVRSKCDEAFEGRFTTGAYSISAHTGRGMDAFISEIVRRAAVFFEGAGHAGLGTARQRSAVSDAMQAIERVLNSQDRVAEFIAEDIRAALSSVGRVTGRIDVEDVLDEVFSRLCVGK